MEHGEEFAGRHEHVITEPTSNNGVMHDRLVWLFLEVAVPARKELWERPVSELLEFLLVGSDFHTGFDAIGVALDTLDSAVVALTDANIASKVADLTAKSDAVAKAITAATAQINAGKELSIVEAAGVLTPAKTLQTKTAKTITDLISKKDLISKAGQIATVKGQLTAQSAAAKGLSDAVVAKMPSATKSIAVNQAKSISDEIARGIAAF